jgi:xanthine dehydrogenase iron-sulfur cluster and FAD-binding subunit A
MLAHDHIMDACFDISGRQSHDDAIEKVIMILQTQNIGVKAARTLDPSRITDIIDRRAQDQRRNIVAGAADYRAAVTSLVIEGALNVDDGRDLLAIVEGIVREGNL